MSPACPQGTRVDRNARTGAPTPADREHLAACPACREAHRLANALSSLADLDLLLPLETPEGGGALPLPSASQVYLRAELRLRREDAERARERAERIARLGSAVGLSATLASLSFAALLTWISLLSGSAGPRAAWMLSGAAGIALLLGCGWALREA